MACSSQANKYTVLQTFIRDKKVDKFNLVAFGFLCHNQFGCRTTCSSSTCNQDCSCTLPNRPIWHNLDVYRDTASLKQSSTHKKAKIQKDSELKVR